MSDLTKHIGSRIRLYRKARNLTLDQLSELIHKSKSTLSKYEAGLVVVDVDTLFDIAKALYIPVTKLMDYQDDSFPDLPRPAAKGFFQQPGYYYLYHLDGNSNQLLHSVIDIQFPAAEGEDYSAVFYNHVRDYSNLHHCDYYYWGNVTFSDLYTNFFFQNQINPVEKCFILVVNPLKNSYVTCGLVQGISNSFLVPVAYKAVFSRQPLTDEALVRKSLQFSKNDLSMIKKRSMLLLADSLSDLRELK